MKLYRLERVQRLQIPVDVAWEFFSSPLNLDDITPDWLNLKVTHPVPAAMYAGMLIHYRVTPFWGVPTTWVTEITHVEKPRFFVDEQRFGPYRFWHHQHHFMAIDGGTEIRDLIHYALHLGPIGGFAQRWLVSPRLRAIFDYRRQALARRFTGRTAAAL